MRDLSSMYEHWNLTEIGVLAQKKNQISKINLISITTLRGPKRKNVPFTSSKIRVVRYFRAHVTDKSQ